MKRASCSISWAALVFCAVLSACLLLLTPHVRAEEIGYREWFDGDVSWDGNNLPTGRHVKDEIPPQVWNAERKQWDDGRIEFYWTDGNKDEDGKFRQHPGYKKYVQTNNTTLPKSRTFYARPGDDSIKDWRQILTKGGASSDVQGGNFDRADEPGNSYGLESDPWIFQPFNQLPLVAYSIPDIALVGTSEPATIYTAVNLPLYFASNPHGFLGGNWQVGQTLEELGISIVNGRVPGVEGIYFATTDFTFDPYSETGYVPLGGESGWLNTGGGGGGSGFATLDVVSHEIIGKHSGVPEPAGIIALSAGIIPLIALRRRRTGRH